MEGIQGVCVCVCVCVYVCVAGNWRDARDTGLCVCVVCVCVCVWQGTGEMQGIQGCVCVCGVCFLFSQVLGLRVYIASVETVSSG